MITTQYLMRLDVKTEISFEKADKLMDRCHAALYSVDTVDVTSFSGNSVCPPYIEVVVENEKRAAKIEIKLKKIIGEWLA